MLIVAMIHLFIYDTVVKDYVAKSRIVNDFSGMCYTETRNGYY